MEPIKIVHPFHSPLWVNFAWRTTLFINVPPFIQPSHSFVSDCLKNCNLAQVFQESVTELLNKVADLIDQFVDEVHNNKILAIRLGLRTESPTIPYVQFSGYSFSLETQAVLDSFFRCVVLDRLLWAFGLLPIESQILQRQHAQTAFHSAQDHCQYAALINNAQKAINLCKTTQLAQSSQFESLEKAGQVTVLKASAYQIASKSLSIASNFLYAIAGTIYGLEENTGKEFIGFLNQARDSCTKIPEEITTGVIEHFRKLRWEDRKWYYRMWFHSVILVLDGKFGNRDGQTTQVKMLEQTSLHVGSIPEKVLRAEQLIIQTIIKVFQSASSQVDRNTIQIFDETLFCTQSNFGNLITNLTSVLSLSGETPVSLVPFKSLTEGIRLHRFNLIDLPSFHCAGQGKRPGDPSQEGPPTKKAKLQWCGYSFEDGVQTLPLLPHEFINMKEGSQIVEGGIDGGGDKDGAGAGAREGNGGGDEDGDGDEDQDGDGDEDGDGDKDGDGDGDENGDEDGGEDEDGDGDGDKDGDKDGGEDGGEYEDEDGDGEYELKQGDAKKGKDKVPTPPKRKSSHKPKNKTGANNEIVQSKKVQRYFQNPFTLKHYNEIKTLIVVEDLKNDIIDLTLEESQGLQPLGTGSKKFCDTIKTEHVVSVWIPQVDPTGEDEPLGRVVFKREELKVPFTNNSYPFEELSKWLALCRFNNSSPPKPVSFCQTISKTKFELLSPQEQRILWRKGNIHIFEDKPNAHREECSKNILTDLGVNMTEKCAIYENQRAKSLEEPISGLRHDTLIQLFEQSEMDKLDCNILDIPLPSALGYCQPRCLRNLSLNSELCGMTAPLDIPHESLQWCLFATPPARTDIHIDAGKFHTWINPQNGIKLWMVQEPLSEVEDVDVSEVDDTQGKWHGMILLPGDVLIMQANTNHRVVTLAESVTMGGHFYSLDNLERTMMAGLREHFWGDTSTNTSHAKSEGLIYRLGLCLSRELQEGEKKRSAISVPAELESKVYPPLIFMLLHPERFVPPLGIDNKPQPESRTIQQLRTLSRKLAVSLLARKSSLLDDVDKLQERWDLPARAQEDR